MDGQKRTAAAGDAQAYIDLLVLAGSEAARIDKKKYQRKLPEITLRALGIESNGNGQQPLLEISDVARSGDGTVANVGIRINGAFQCPDCRQKFDSERAQQLHWKFIHDPNRHQ